MENINNGNAPSNSTSTSAAAAEASIGGDKENIKRELCGILKDNMLYSIICLLLIVIAIIPSPPFVTRVVEWISIFSLSTISNGIMLGMMHFGGEESVDRVLYLCGTKVFAYFLSLHFPTHLRATKILNKLEQYHKQREQEERQQEQDEDSAV